MKSAAGKMKCLAEKRYLFIKNDKTEIAARSRNGIMIFESLFSAIYLSVRVFFETGLM